MSRLLRTRPVMFGVVLLAAAGLLWWCSAKPARLTGAKAPNFTPDAPSPSERLKVTFWNVDWFPGQRPNASDAKRRAHVAAVVPVVDRLDPDILGLEEVADRDAAQLLIAHLPGFKVDVCSEFTRGDAPSGQQEVLCSRLPLIQGHWENWRPGPDGLQPRRGFAFAEYRLPAGGVALVYGVHLKSNRVDDSAGPEANIAEREEAMRQLLRYEQAAAAVLIESGPLVLTIVGGDMNTSLDDPRFAAETTLRDLRARGHFRWAWEGVPADARLTLPAEGRYPSVCFDHIFFRGDDDVRLLGCSLEPTDHTASDHRPVTATFAW